VLANKESANRAQSVLEGTERELLAANIEGMLTRDDDDDTENNTYLLRSITPEPLMKSTRRITAEPIVKSTRRTQFLSKLKLFKKKK
jgi:hypothetical protein